MRDLAVLAVHLIAMIAKLLAPGGARSIISESLLLKRQLLILNRSRVRAPNLRPIDRIIASLCAGLMRPARLLRSAIVLKPSTLMAFHRALVNRKYRLLFAPRRRKPGPKGPSPELIAVIVEMKRRNARFGCRRFAQRIAFVFGVEIDKDVVRRVLAKHCRPTSARRTVLAHVPRTCQGQPLESRSLILKTHWVMVVMDQSSRRIIGFAVQPGAVDGPALCRMFNQIIAGAPRLPQQLSSDHDPLFQFHRWKANLRILDVSEIKTVPYVPLSHPFATHTLQAQLSEHAVRVMFHHCDAECELARDLFVRKTSADQARDVAFATGQAGVIRRRTRRISKRISVRSASKEGAEETSCDFLLARQSTSDGVAHRFDESSDPGIARNESTKARASRTHNILSL
jgi:putative transposase